MMVAEMLLDGTE